MYVYTYILKIRLNLQKQGWQKSGENSYFPAGWSDILVFPGKYWEIKFSCKLYTFNHIFWNVESNKFCHEK